MKTSQTERIGVHKVALIVIEKLNWIWREMPVCDFGIDGIIEQTENGRPNGKLIAVQIKSGLGNVHHSKKDYIYYASNTHKEYWSNYTIPVILILFDPESNNTYWTSANQTDFKKTKERWKLNISKYQFFSEKSKKKLIDILNDGNNFSTFNSIFDGSIKPETLEDHVAKLDHVSEAGDSINRIVGIIDEMRHEVNSYNSILKGHIDNGLDDNDVKVKASINGLASNLDIRTKRIKSELEILSQSFSESIYSLEIVTIAHYKLTLDLDYLDKMKNIIEVIPEATLDALEGVNIMEESFEKYPSKYPSLKIAREKCIAISKMIKNEFTTISDLSKNLIQNIENAK